MKISELKDAPQWLLDARTEYADVEIINGVVHWYDGVWFGGEWRGVVARGVVACGVVACGVAASQLCALNTYRYRLPKI